MMILLVGNVGSGKSSEAVRLLYQYTNLEFYVVDTDSLIYMFNAGKYDFKESEKETYSHIKHAIVAVLLTRGKNVIVDGTNHTTGIRKSYTELAVARGHEVHCIDFGPGDKKGLERRQTLDRRAKSKKLWKEVWERIRTQYQSPSYREKFINIDRRYE